MREVAVTIAGALFIFFLAFIFASAAEHWSSPECDCSAALRENRLACCPDAGDSVDL